MEGMQSVPVDHIRALKIIPDPEFTVVEVLVRPKRQHMEKCIGLVDMTDSVTLHDIFPGHAMISMKDELFQPKAIWWALSTIDGSLDLVFAGPALVFGMKNSQVSDCELYTDEFLRALTEVSGLEG
jgi:hypothetical protein